jgi:hypothetical protein
MRFMAPAVLAMMFATGWTDLAGSGTGGGVSATAGSSTYSSLAIDSLGRPWIAWEELSDQKDILLRRWDGSAWVGVGGSETGRGLSILGGSNEAPSLVLDSTDHPVVAWRHNFGVHVRRWDGAAWVPYGNSATDFGVADGPSAFSVKIKLDSSNRPVVLWMVYPPTTNQPLPSQIYLKRWNGSSWEELAGSASGGGISNAQYFSDAPDLALDAAGNPVVTWLQADAPAVNRILLKRWNGTAWEGIGGSGSGDGLSGPGSSGDYPSIALDSLQRPVVAWHEYGLSGAGLGEIYLRRWDGTAWVGLGGSDTLGGISAANGVGARYPSLKLGTSDRPVVAWQNGPLFSTDEIYVRRWDGSAWVEVAGSASGGGVSQTPAVSSGFVSLALTPAGDPAVTWTEGYSNITSSSPEILYRQLTTVPDPLLTVTALAPAPGSVLNKLPRTLTVTLSAAPDPLTVNGVSVTLVQAGKDNILGTADDVHVTPAVSVAGSKITVNLCGIVLQKGKYRLRVKGVAGNGPASAVRDALGNLLDGEFSGAFPSGNGSAGGDFVADFTLTVAGRPK